MLRELPSRRSAFIAGDLTEAGIPVMVAVRTLEHGIVTGELAIPNERWGAALFLSFLQEQDYEIPS